jgi:hypothetical protein
LALKFVNEIILTATGVYKICDRQTRLGAKATLLALVNKWVSLIKIHILRYSKDAVATEKYFI